jgi:hypothetical protein
VRADYEKALTLAEDGLGPVLPERTPVALNTDWRGPRGTILLPIEAPSADQASE